MNVKGILVETHDGSSYLLGIGPRKSGAQAERPTVWRVNGATFESLEESRTASRTIREEFDLPVPLASGQTHDEHIKQAVLEALTAFIKQYFGQVRW